MSGISRDLYKKTVKGEGLDYWSCEDCQQPTAPTEVSLPGQPTQRVLA
jgi:hypothetical protein